MVVICTMRDPPRLPILKLANKGVTGQIIKKRAAQVRYDRQEGER